MEKYFNNYSEAVTYLAESVLTDGKKKIVQIEELKMNNDNIFYKLTVESYQDRECGWPWITTTPEIVPFVGDYPGGQPKIWYGTLYEDKPYGYDFTCNTTAKAKHGYNPYQE